MAEENKVVFKCQKCSKPFIVRQGSRRRYCDDCLVERISHKGGEAIASPIKRP